MNVQHTAATPEGMTVSAKAVLKRSTAVSSYSTSAHQTARVLSESGTHKRFVVYGERFTEKAKS